MKLLLSIFVVVLCLSVISAQLKPTSCGSKRQAVTLKKFEIDNCTEFPCILTRGTNASLTMELAATSRITGLKLSIFGIISGKEVPFSVNSNDHCKAAIKGGCPLARGKSYTYKNSIQVLSQYPAISVSVRYQLNDVAGKPVLCVQWPAKIV